MSVLRSFSTSSRHCRSSLSLTMDLGELPYKNSDHKSLIYSELAVPWLSSVVKSKRHGSSEWTSRSRTLTDRGQPCYWNAATLQHDTRNSLRVCLFRLSSSVSRPCWPLQPRHHHLQHSVYRGPMIMSWRCDVSPYSPRHHGMVCWEIQK